MRTAAIATTLITITAFIALACAGGGSAQPTSRPIALLATSTSPPTATATPEPAAETLAFIRDGDIWMIDADGSDERRLTEFPGTGREVLSFQWLNNGGTIAYQVSLLHDPSTPPPSTSTWVVSTIDGMILWERELPSGWPTAVFWSPDGRLVAVREEARISIEDRDGHTWWESALPATTLYGAYRAGGWSPEGQAFAYIDGQDIVVVSGEPPAARRLTMFSAMCPDGELCLNRAVFGGLAFSSDASRLVALVTREVMIAAVGNAPWETYRIELGPTPTHALLSEPLTSDQPQLGNVSGLAYSPDARFVAYRLSYHISACENGASLVILPVEGVPKYYVPQEVAAARANRTPIGPETHRGTGLRVLEFAWSPTGDALVASFELFDCSFMGGVTPGVDPVLARGVFLVHPEDLSEENLSDDVASSAPVWSSSGRFIAYATGRREEKPELHVIDIVTREVVDLTEGDAPAWQPQP